MECDASNGNGTLFLSLYLGRFLKIFYGLDFFKCDSNSLQKTFNRFFAPFGNGAKKSIDFVSKVVFNVKNLSGKIFFTL